MTVDGSSFSRAVLIVGLLLAPAGCDRTPASSASSPERTSGDAAAPRDASPPPGDAARAPGDAAPTDACADLACLARPERGQWPSIAALPGGGFALSWVEDGMWLQTFDAAGAPSSDPLRLDPVWRPMAQDPSMQFASDLARTPSALASDAQGRLAVTWTSENGVSLQRLSPALEPLGLLPW
jgi:hypothetical protein